MPVTRTLNPLPFEHLEPKRFEDLVRQIIYDFRHWRTLEATGRSGSDDGFDARAIEATGGAALSDLEDDDEPEGPGFEVPRDRVWLIQCKREREIGPSKMISHLEAIPKPSLEDLYGLIFAAACDFSKASRDACREWCRERGIQEVYVWGRGEIEDQLFQPKNDNLLFAYFGISLQIRRQGTGSKIRRGIALKRKIRKIQEERNWPGPTIIIRDPSDERYPSIDSKGWDEGEYLWRPASSLGPGVFGLRVVLRQHYAYYDPKTGEWDFATGYNYIYPHEAETLWWPPSRLRTSEAILDVWRRMPRENQVHFRLVGTLPYDEIVEIDLEPDDFCKFPTVFTTFRQLNSGGYEPPYLKSVDVQLEGSEYGTPAWAPEKHVRVFPTELRDSQWEREWSALNGFCISCRIVAPPVDPEIDAMLNKIAAENREIE